MYSACYPEARLSVIALTNRTDGDSWCIAQRIADLWLGEDAAVGGEPSVPIWPFQRHQ